MTADMAHELRSHGVTVLSLYPGLVRAESVLAAAAQGWLNLSNSESPEFIGRVIAALAADAHAIDRSGEVVVAAEAAVQLRRIGRRRSTAAPSHAGGRVSSQENRIRLLGMADQQPKQINFTILPDEDSSAPRTYANFCSIAHTPFDFTLTFCEVMPLSDKEIKEAETQHVVRAPVRAKIVVPGAVRAEPDRRAAGALARLQRVLQQRRLEQRHRAGRSLENQRFQI